MGNAKSYIKNLKNAALSAAAFFATMACDSNIASQQDESSTKNVAYWLTKGDETVKLQQQKSISFSQQINNSFPIIEVDETQTFQTIDGFGYTLTGGSVEVINRLTTEKRNALLQEIFGKKEGNISVSYLRLSVGASDLDSEVFSYNDLPEGETDFNLKKFSLARDKDLIAMLKEILSINPEIKIIAAPWSPPVWMKDNGSSIGGSLKPEYYGVYAKYFVKYIQGMEKEGITIDAITPQNEPLHPGNNPSLLMTSEMQREFIKNHMGPAFKNAGVKTKIVVYDHNCNKP